MVFKGTRIINLEDLLGSKPHLHRCCIQGFNETRIGSYS